MNSSASSRALWSSSSTCRICERTETSSIETGSSQMIPSGSSTSVGRDRDALALPARQLVRVAVDEARRLHPDVLERALHARRVLAARHARPPPAARRRSRGHAPARVQRLVRVLEDHLDVAAQRPQRGPPLHRRAVGRDRPGRRRHEPEHRARERRLPAARLPHDPEDLAAPPLERHAVERARHAAARREVDGEVADLHQRRHRAPPPPRPARASAPTARSGTRPTAPGRPRAAPAPPHSASAAYGQRGRNEQPDGASAGSGGAAGDRHRERRGCRRSPAASRAGASCTGAAATEKTASTGPRLHDPARVHHRHPVAGLGQHREVVADQDQREPELAPAAARAGRGSAPA